MIRLARCGLLPGRLALVVMVLTFGALPRAAAQEMSVPVEIQVPLLLKIFSFDRALTGPRSDPLVIGVVFQGRNRNSSEIGEEVRGRLTAASRQPAAGRVIRVVSIDLDKSRDLRAALLRDSVRVLYVAPLRAFAVATVTAVTREGQIVTLTGVPDYVEQGLAVGFDVTGVRPQIVINLAASRAEGALFSADLLKLARLAGPRSLAP